MSKIQLLQGDCLKLLEDISDNSVDLVLADPPYGTTQNKWDLAFDVPWSQLYRIAKSKAPIVLFAQLPFAVDVITSNRKNYCYEWIWHKTCPVGYFDANWKPLRAHENILVFSAGKKSTYNPQYWYSKPYVRKQHAQTNSYDTNVNRIPTTSENGRRYPIDVLTYSRDQGYHPTQKPIKLLEYLILTYTNEGETVLDFTMGSGSTGVACVNTSRNFIGMELDPGYFEIAKQRIEEAQRNLSGPAV